MAKPNVQLDRVRAARGDIQHALAAVARVDNKVIKVQTRDIYLDLAREFTTKALQRLSAIPKARAITGLLGDCKRELEDVRLDANYAKEVKRQLNGAFTQLYHLEGRLSSQS